jgi:hypothetical protein
MGGSHKKWFGAEAVGNSICQVKRYCIALAGGMQIFGIFLGQLWRFYSSDRAVS